MYAKIEPVAVYPNTADVLCLGNVNLNPNVSASFIWYFQEEATRKVLLSGTLAISGEDYSAWGSDDSYLYTYAAAQLKLKIINIVPDDLAQSPVPSSVVPAIVEVTAASVD